MRRVLLLLALTACTKAGSESVSEDVPIATAEVKRVDSIPAVSPITPPAPPAKTAPKPSARVELTAVTLADDCGPRTAPKAAQSGAQAEMGGGARARHRCEQPSMQLSVTATDAMNLKVKSVKLYDEKGTLVGTLTAARPTKWSQATSVYESWNEAVPANTTISVSYVLSQPSWDRVADRWNKTFTLKAVVTVGGVDKTTQRDVALHAPTSLPPNVRT